MKHPIKILFTVSVLVFGCKSITEQGKYDDAMAHQNKIALSVNPIIETTPIAAAASDDSADDPAFWYNKKTPAKSVVYGTNKKGGIYAYDLEGKVLNYYKIGKVNNIDVRQNWVVGTDTLAILGGSNRTHHSLDLFTIDSIGNLSPLFESPFIVDKGIDNVYGFCLYQPNSNELYAIINGKNGVVYQYNLTFENDMLKLTKTNSLEFDTQVEGMVADDDNKVLFVGEEDKGVWAVSLKDNTKQLIKNSSAANNPAITYDIEGLALYKKDAKEGYLVISIQGGFNYAVFNRNPPFDYINSFKVVGNNSIDGTEETDGIEIYSNAIGAQFPEGLMMIQDGFNYEGDSLISQNFKYVALEDLLKQLK